MAGRNKETIKASQLNFTAELQGTFIVRGTINGIEYMYNFVCDVYPRFIGYTPTIGEVQFLKKLADVYLDREDVRQELLENMIA